MIHSYRNTATGAELPPATPATNHDEITRVQVALALLLAVGFLALIWLLLVVTP